MTTFLYIYPWYSHHFSIQPKTFITPFCLFVHGVLTILLCNRRHLHDNISLSVRKHLHGISLSGHGVLTIFSIQPTYINDISLSVHGVLTIRLYKHISTAAHNFSLAHDLPSHINIGSV